MAIPSASSTYIKASGVAPQSQQSTAPSGSLSGAVTLDNGGTNFPSDQQKDMVAPTHDVGSGTNQNEL